MLATGVHILRSRYRLVAGPVLNGEISQSWIGIDEDDNKFLVKVWPFEGDRPDDLQRALWDAELRTLYRVGSSPGAENSILVIRDAGVDRDSRCFAMVLQAPGYEPLSVALGQRAATPWLQSRESQSRIALWTGLARLAEGVVLLHEQHIIHRDIGADTVYYASGVGPSSFRLGGFEWSVRLGRPAGKTPPPGWSSPPEFFSGAYGYRPETDWFGFGMLAVRLLLNAEPHAQLEPPRRHSKILIDLDRSANRLADIEVSLLKRLIAFDPKERLTRGYEVLGAIHDVLHALDRGGAVGGDTRPLVLVIHPAASPELAERAVEFGLVLNPERPRDPFNPREPLHVANLATFIQRDLANAKLYAVPDADYFILVGGQFVFRVTQFEYTDRDTGDTIRNWDMAFCQSVTDLKWSDGGAAITDLPPSGLVVRSRTLVLKDRTVRQDAKSWLGYLPRIDRALQLRASLARFHEFIRFTNQVELLIRDSEIFQYRVVAHALDGGRDVLTLEETERKRPPIRFAKVAGGLCEFLIREIEAHKPDGRLVVLSAVSDDALILPSVPKAHAWTVVQVDSDTRRVTVQRVSTSGVRAKVPDTGAIRAWGLFGQVALIKRRKGAIDRIAKHAYLLRSLSAPGQVYMDTGHASLPVPLPVALVDEAKQAAIADVLRVRPIYALQGPPGTGKTTLVAHLLRQIFEDDPVAQVLITAQAHGAVDVLRLKVRHEAFRDVPENAQPLAVRLGLKAEGAQLTSGSVEEVSLQVLRTARTRLEAQSARTPLQEDWLQTVREMEQALITLDSESTVPDFCEVVKRGASITYCTTSAGDLEALAEATQSFDWAIIEEAGKAHGFDLALPLQTGHRWLLIGDHKQLPPYRFKDYRDGIDGVDDVIEALEALPLRGGFLLDDEWITAWRARSPQERDDFKDYAREWLNTFERVFEYCSRATGVVAQTIDESNGAAAGMLSRQHRMHPTIGDLISTAYYQDQLVNRTVASDGAPLDRVRHGLRGVPGLTGEAILWIDLPWAAKDGRSEEVGDAQGRPRYTNPSEVAAVTEFLECLGRNAPEAASSSGLELAVLSPYNQQVAAINRAIKAKGGAEFVARAGLSPKAGLHGRERDGDNDPGIRVAHSVDSFQGNQAGVIVVSLVRNNRRPPGTGLGFLDEASRINVLLSRAERLLVLVGSWEFFQYQLQAVSIDDPHFPLWHWKKVVKTLESWFEAGRALKVSASDLAGGIK